MNTTTATTTQLALQVERMRKRLARLTTDFHHLAAAVDALEATTQAPPSTLQGHQLLLEAPAAPFHPATVANSVANSATVAKEENDEKRKLTKKKEEKEEKSEIYTREPSLFSDDTELRKQNLWLRLQPHIPQHGEDALRRFHAFWTQPSAYVPGRMRFELPSFHLETKLATWVNYGPNTGLAIARTRQKEEARQRAIQAEQERTATQAQRAQQWQRQQEEFVPLPVIQAFAQAHLGDPYAMNRTQMEAAMRQAQAADTPLPPILTDWLSGHYTPPT